MSQITVMQPSKSAPAATQSRVKKILVPVDFGAPSMHALAYAGDLAKQLGASLDVISVVTVPYLMPVTDAGLVQLPAEFVRSVMHDAERGLADAVAESGLAHARATVVTGDPRAEILSYAAAENVDLIIMGTRGRTGAGHLIFGSVAEHVVRTAPCPVLTVR